MTDQPVSPYAGARVTAVVVTFNRLDLLRGLLERLESVPGLTEVLVVDNASTDGTGEWLAGLADRDPTGDRATVPVLGRTLATNGGGAQGFHDGLSWAVERGAAEGDVVFEGGTNAMAAVVYGPRPLTEMIGAGMVRLSGDPAQGQRFVDLFSLSR